ncbi:hypothetical protein Cni_G16475 [Canna indica]|uniref:Uncharacterized protein n=1 Tax=Canna indica TaxID=4628 RepID=A0AAQ3KF70_9LILI|nr:hypothetical protein Cni_G16475 [Canna indica]
MTWKKIQRDESYGRISDLDDAPIGDDQDEEEEFTQQAKRICRKRKEPMISNKSSTKKGLMDLILYQDLKKNMQEGKLRQTYINDACDKEVRARTIQYIARFFYQASVD